MKIVIVNTLYRTFSFGGAEVSVDFLATQLNANGHDVTVICLDGESSSYSMQSDGIEVYRLKINNLYWQYDKEHRSFHEKLRWHLKEVWNYLSYRDVKNILEKIKPDIFHTNVITGFSTSIWKAAYDLNIPIVHTLRDYYLKCSRSTMYKAGHQCTSPCFDCLLFTRGRKSSCRYVSFFVGISAKIINDHREIIASKPSKVVFNPVNFNSTRINKGLKVNGVVNIGMIGRISKEKGFLEFAYEFNSHKDMNAILHIAGDGDFGIEMELIKLSEIDPRIFFYHRMNSSEFFNKLDLLVIPSRWNEPFGRIIPEAYSHGVSCIGRNVGGIPEIIKNNKTGLIFETDLDAINIIKRILLDNSSLLDWNDNALMESRNFSSEIIGSYYEDIYRNLCFSK